MEEEKDEYTSFVGKYIQLSNELEGISTFFVIKHYVGFNDSVKLNEFLSNFIVKPEMTFQRIVKIFFDIIKTHHSEFQTKNKELFCSNILNEIVWYRNILAHSTFMKCDEIEVYYLNWFSNDERLKKYEIDDIYNFKIKKSEFMNYYIKLKSIISILNLDSLGR
ncbi:MAG: hypothetical protein A3K10_16175 [Bacteroidetes bacterium RIFCSPLOWO2_12_FULL_31_6]|nr:MAG: hypothetical protein A3K10_16175 [Bacteroidetes bacterium RIFCSPLOWO2_12_FULL_31_6]